MTAIYRYTITIEGFDPYEIEAEDVEHALSELRDDAQLWPKGSTGQEAIASIVRGDKCGEV